MASLEEPLVEEEPAEEPVEISENDVRQLRDMTGCSNDECHAALLQHGGSLEEAAVQLLEREPAPAAERPPDRAQSDRAAAPPQSAEDEEQGASYLAEATGRQLAECRTALRAHGGSIDQAAATLLSLPPAQAAASSSAAAVDQDEGGAASPQEAQQAAMVSEATGRALPACLAALRSCGGRPEDAVMALLTSSPPSSGAAGSASAAAAHAGVAADRAPLGVANVSLNAEDPFSLGDSPVRLQPPVAVGPPDSPMFRAPAGEAHDIAAELGLASPSPLRVDPAPEAPAREAHDIAAELGLASPSPLRGDPDAETDPEAEAPPAKPAPQCDPDAETDPEPEAPLAKRRREDNGGPSTVAESVD